MRKILNKFFSKKLHIFYRHVHSSDKKNKKSRPDWFSFESCFLNLIDSLERDKSNLKFDLTVMFDGDDHSYQIDFMSDFMKNFDKKLDINLVIFKGGGTVQSFEKTLEYIVSLNYGEKEWIYLLENDYLHNLDWIKKLDDLFASGVPFDYVSLYDHQDKYEFTPRFHRSHQGLKSTLYVAKTHHWRTAPSTCGSFILSAKTLKEDLNIIRDGGMDHQFFDLLIRDKGRTLLTPVPGLSTHVMLDLMSPTIDWGGLSRLYSNQI